MATSWTTGLPVPTCVADAARRPRAAATAVLALLVLLVGLVHGGPSRAQEAEAALPDVRLVLARLTGVVGPGAVPEGVAPPAQVLVRVLVEHRGQEVLQDAEVLVETFGRVVSRTSLHEVLDAGRADDPRLVQRFDVRDGEVEPGDVAAVDAFLDVDRITEGDRTGVYPLKVSLTRGTTVLDQVVTAVVHLGEVPVNPLDAVVVWPVDLAPADATDDGREALDAQLAPGGRLDEIVSGLEAAPSSGVVPAVSASLLDTLVARAGPSDLPDPEVPDEELEPAQLAVRRAAAPAAAMLARLRSLLTSLTHPPVAGAFADADLTALLQGGPDLARLAGELAAEGPLLVGGLGGRTPDPVTHLGTAPLDARALDLLPGDHLLLPWESLVGPDLEVNPSLPHPVRRLRSTSGRLLTATVADPWVGRAIADPPVGHGPLVAVQRVVAETALVQFESPGVADRPLLVLPPRDWSPDARFARALVPALVNAPWLRLADSSTHGDAAAGSLQEATFAEGDHLPPETVAAIGAARSALAGLTASLPDEAVEVAGRPVAELTDRLRRSTSHWFADDPARAEAMVAGVRRAIDEAYGSVEVPTADTITLTGEQGRIPITVRRPSGDPIEVEVEVRSRGTLSWPGGTVQRRRLGTGETRTLSFDVTTRSRGDVPVEVVVRDLSGSRVLADATIRVRSTFVSGPALGITAGVVVLLLLVGRLRRRPSRHDPGDPDDAGEGGGHSLSVLPGAGGGGAT